jgi:hypothetical protein
VPITLDHGNGHAGLCPSYIGILFFGNRLTGSHGDRASEVRMRSNTVKPIECLHYALNLPTSVVITGMDRMEILDQAFEAVRTFQPMSEEQVQALLAKTASAGARGEFEPFKTSSIFDGTAQHPAWLGEEPQRLQQLMSA